MTCSTRCGEAVTSFVVDDPVRTALISAYQQELNDWNDTSSRAETMKTRSSILNIWRTDEAAIKVQNNLDKQLALVQAEAETSGKLHDSLEKARTIAKRIREEKLEIRGMDTSEVKFSQEDDDALHAKAFASAPPEMSSLEDDDEYGYESAQKRCVCW